MGVRVIIIITATTIQLLTCILWYIVKIRPYSNKMKQLNAVYKTMYLTVADPGFDLRGGVDFVNGGWGWVENH